MPKLDPKRLLRSAALLTFLAAFAHPAPLGAGEPKAPASEMAALLAKIRGNVETAEFFMTPTFEASLSKAQRAQWLRTLKELEALTNKDVRVRTKDHFNSLPGPQKRKIKKEQATRKQ